MTALVRSELLKVRTVRTFLWITLASVALIVIASISVSASSGTIQSAADDRSVARIAAVTLIFALIGGIVVMAGGAPHRTHPPTVSRVPGPPRGCPRGGRRAG